MKWKLSAAEIARARVRKRRLVKKILFSQFLGIVESNEKIIIRAVIFVERNDLFYYFCERLFLHTGLIAKKFQNYSSMNSKGSGASGSFASSFAFGP